MEAAVEAAVEAAARAGRRRRRRRGIGAGGGRYIYFGGTPEEDETRGVSFGYGSRSAHRTHATTEKRHRHQ